MIDLKKLVKAGVHFGHQTARWNPKMAFYIWGSRSGVHLIDVSKTAHQLEKAAKFLESVAADGKQIMWVGTKKQAQGTVAKVAAINMPYVTHRWIGGTLTNSSQVRKSITRLLHFEDIVAKSTDSHYKKKEIGTFQKIVDRLQKNIGGIRTLRWPVGAVVLVDVRKEQTALREAHAMGIPVVALVDTNSDPSCVDYVIPANDDSPKSIQVIIEHLIEATQRGTAQAAHKKATAVVEQVLSKETSDEDVALARLDAAGEDDGKKSKKTSSQKKHLKST